MGLTHQPFSALCTILPVQLQCKQLNQQHLTWENTGKQQWPCPRTTDTNMICQNQKLSALVARYSRGQQRAHATLEWPLSGRHYEHTTFLCMTILGLLPVSSMASGCHPVQFLRNTWEVFYISFVCRGTSTQNNSSL